MTFALYIWWISMDKPPQVLQRLRISYNRCRHLGGAISKFVMLACHGFKPSKEDSP